MFEHFELLDRLAPIWGEFSGKQSRRHFGSNEQQFTRCSARRQNRKQQRQAKKRGRR